MTTTKKEIELEVKKVNPNPEVGDCACGEKLHYTDPEKQKRVQALVDQLGEFIKVEHNYKTYLVQRHYIALHGIKAVDLSELGFIQVSKF